MILSNSALIKRILCVCALVALPSAALAQEAVLTGTVTDTTGGVLPGVTVTASNTATGNVFTAVTDGTGTYRVPVRVSTGHGCRATCRMTKGTAARVPAGVLRICLGRSGLDAARCPGSFSCTRTHRVRAARQLIYHLGVEGVSHETCERRVPGRTAISHHSSVARGAAAGYTSRRQACVVGRSQ